MNASICVIPDSMWFISHSWEIEWCSLYMSLCFFLSIVVTNPYAMKTGFLFRTSWAPKVWNKVHLKWAKEGTEAKKSHPPEAFNLMPSSPAMPSPTEARCLEPFIFSLHHKPQKPPSTWRTKGPYVIMHVGGQTSLTSATVKWPIS